MTYGHDHKGNPIQTPDGFRMLEFGEEVPSGHIVYGHDSSGQYAWYGNYGPWRNNRSTINNLRIRGTMTPIWATVWGWCLAFAVPENTPRQKMWKTNTTVEPPEHL